MAAATGSLCEAANAAIQGNCSEEKLVASAKAVSNSTAQLLLACKRGDSTSKTQKGLQVTRTTKVFFNIIVNNAAVKHLTCTLFSLPCPLYTVHGLF